MMPNHQSPRIPSIPNRQSPRIAPTPPNIQQSPRFTRGLHNPMENQFNCNSPSAPWPATININSSGSLTARPSQKDGIYDNMNLQSPQFYYPEMFSPRSPGYESLRETHPRSGESIPIVIPRSRHGEPEQIWLEEDIEPMKERPYQQVIQHSPRIPVSDIVMDACTTSTEYARNLKHQILDWITHDTTDQNNRMPPCPPYSLLCRCIEPTRIKPISDTLICDCGSPEFRCDDCFGLLAVCPYCGRSVPCQQRLQIAPCFAPAKPSPPSPSPELIVTSVGPFRDKRYAEERRPCFQCVGGLGLADVATNCAVQAGRVIGSTLACQRDPPPIPVPGRPIQRLMPFFFPPAPPAKSSFPFNFLRKPDPVYKPPKGGLAGALEDVCAVGLGTTGLAIDGVAAALNATTFGWSGAPVCDCDSPLLRYPKNGIYGDPPVAPTKATGCRIIDAFNNFMDALTGEPSKQENLELVKESEIPETEKTGIHIIDTVNELLDNLIPAPADISRTQHQHNPIQAILTYFTERSVKEPKEPDLLPWLSPGEDGLNVIERHLPTVCLGQNLDIEPREDAIDYVNFSLSPTNISVVESQRTSSGGSPLVPVHY